MRKTRIVTEILHHQLLEGRTMQYSEAKAKMIELYTLWDKKDQAVFLRSVEEALGLEFGKAYLPAEFLFRPKNHN